MLARLHTLAQARAYSIRVRMMIAYFRIDTIHIKRACMRLHWYECACLLCMLPLSFSIARSLPHIVACHNCCFYVRTHAYMHIAHSLRPVLHAPMQIAIECVMVLRCVAAVVPVKFLPSGCVKCVCGCFF